MTRETATYWGILEKGILTGTASVTLYTNLIDGSMNLTPAQEVIAMKKAAQDQSQPALRSKKVPA